MTVLRWIVLLLVLLPAVAAPPFVSAQDGAATAGSSAPVAEAGVTRQFERSGLTLVGPGVMRTFVVIYASPEEASQALPLVVKDLREQMTGLASDELQTASTPKIGDERLAYAGPVMAGEQEAQTGIFAWREGNRVYLMVTAGLSGDMLEPLFAIGATLTGRTLPATEAVQATEEGEMSRGGAFELLPTLDDMPPGWVFSEDANLMATESSATPES